MMHLFVNGKEEGTPTQVGNLVTGTNRLWQIGSPAQGGFGIFAPLANYSGLVDDLRLYERPLTRLEVESTMNGKPNPDIVASVPTVSIKATDPIAKETSTADTGVFTITRDGNTASALVVSYFTNSGALVAAPNNGRTVH